MTSNATRKQAPTEAYVWIWLPGKVSPVVAGRLSAAESGYPFNYGRSYLERDDAIPLYLPELPLQPGLLPPLPGLFIPGCLRDASPDAWGRRVIINRLLGEGSPHTDTTVLDELTYMLTSGSDRVGAVDFQASPDEYVPRLAEQASLEQLIEAADLVEKGRALPPGLTQAMLHGTSLGGARPKALIEDRDRKYVAKFASSSDLYAVIKAEFVAMRIGSRIGLDVARVKRVTAGGKDVLLVERFDRQKATGGWQRKGVVSALTLLELDEMMARYASYEHLAEIIRHRFVAPQNTLREMFGRLVFNVLCGNTDDHARNHAAFWDGNHLALTPAYDICPQARTGNEASQAMLISGGNRASRLDVCILAARQFLLSETEARALIDQQIEGIHKHWESVCDEAELSAADRNLLWRRQFLNPYALGA